VYRPVRCFPSTTPPQTWINRKAFHRLAIVLTHSDIQQAHSVTSSSLSLSISGQNPRLLLMGTIFFFSGFSSLLYEVVWMRRLSLFFGSDIYSAALTVGTFMGGLTLGSILAARFVDRAEKTLAWYGLLEILIGLYALSFPAFLGMFSDQYRHIYQSFFEIAPWVYNGFRVMVAAATLLVPTTMMGATLPLMVKRFGQEGKVGKYSGFFYSVNTLGAMIGVLVVGFLILPTAGMLRSTWVGCGINLLIGSTAILLQLASVQEISCPAPPTRQVMARKDSDHNIQRKALIAIGFSGMAALALEVIWMRMLTQSFSGAVYSFSIMLSCFLFGIAYGSKKIARTADAHPDPVALFGWIELVIAASVALLGILTYFVPTLFNALLWKLVAVFHGQFGIACTVAEFLISATLIGVPTVLLGATFPVAVKICTPVVTTVGRGTAVVYAANTLGAVAGALIAGLALLPSFGSRISLLIVAGLFAATGTFLTYWAGEKGWSNLRRSRVILLLSSFAAFGTIASLLPQQRILNFRNMRHGSGAVTLYHHEGITHTVDIFKTSNNVVVMAVNGTTEADTTYTQRRHFILKADLPLLLHPHPRDIAVVGLGLGITLSTSARYPAVERIQVLELSPDMARAQNYLEEVSGGVLRNPKINIRIDDGRNFLAMSDQRFDMITADPIHPRVSGVGYLYTREYYQALKAHLRPDGVVCQWMPMYNISKQSFDVAFRTFASVFPNASFWYVKSHGLFVATQDEFSIDFGELARRMEAPAVKADLASIDIHGPAELLSYMAMGPDEIRAYLAANQSDVLNTDDNAYLEYHTPFEFLQANGINGKDVHKIIAGLIPYTSLNLKIVRNLTPEDERQIVALWAQRKNELVPELSAKLN
jgi:spermidine synthase